MKDWYQKEKQELFDLLKTSEKGLSTQEAKDRQKTYGLNILPKKEPDSLFQIFFKELKDPIVLLLLIAACFSFLSGEAIDGFAIIFIVLIDLILGTYQENKANHTAEALSKLVSVTSKVMRDDRIVEIPSTDLTIGDFVLLESGDKICADLRIIECHNFLVDESILTGESVSVLKKAEAIKKENVGLVEQENMAFSGTTVVTGRAKAVVVQVGLKTEIGKIAQTINETEEEKSPLTIRVEKLSRQISLFILVIAIGITILLISKGESYQNIFLSVIALSVSAMPEGLPLALTMALTIASNKMAKKNVVTKKLHSVESLGSCTVIASDKTGTLTVNEQTAKKILLPDGQMYNITGTGYNTQGHVQGKNLEYAKEIALLGTINNEAHIEENKGFGDSIDLAFLVLGEKLKVQTDNIEILDVIPYESENKYSAVFYKEQEETYCTVKGSLEKVLSFCKSVQRLPKMEKEKIYAQNEMLAKEGYRVIALAKGKVKKKGPYKEKEIKNLTFMGFVAFIDPIRKEAKDSIEKAKKAGIQVLMITGDHPLTAFSIAKELKLVKTYDQVTEGNEVDFYLRQGEKEFDQFVKEKIVYTRVTPLQKLEIVNSLKRQGEFVAVTGDGVNDAPALQSANIGIAMGSGTDIAKETAKMIIMDDNFTSIVSGIEEGRVAYANIRKILFFLISCGLAEVLFFCLAILCNMPMPLVAIQLLWLNVVTDGIQDLALSFEPAEENIMKEKPVDPKESIFNKSLFEEIAVSGVIIGFVVFAVWFYLIDVLHLDSICARSYILALMVFIQNIHVFNCRSEKKSAFRVSLSKNWFIVFGVIASVLLHFIVMEVDFLAVLLQTIQVPLTTVFILFLVASSILFFMELYKKMKNT